jgi:hypothetical protein
MRCLIVCRDVPSHWVRHYFDNLHPYALKFFNQPVLDYYLEFCHSLAIKEIRIVMEQPDAALESRYETGKYPGLHITFNPVFPGEPLDSVIEKNHAFCKDTDLVIMEGLFIIERESGHAFRRSLEKGNPSRCVSCSSGRILFIRQEDSSSLRTLELPEDKDPGFRLKELSSILSFYALSMEWLRVPEKQTHLVSGKPGKSPAKVSLHIPRHSLLVSPVLIDKKVRIHNYCLVGPDVIIGSRVIVDSHTSIERSIIYDDSYIGRELEIHEKIIYRNKLISPLDGEWIHLEPRYLTPLTDHHRVITEFRFLFHWLVCLLLVITGLIPYLFMRVGLLLTGYPKGEKASYYLDKTKKAVLLPRPMEHWGTNGWSRWFYRLSLDKYPLLFRVLAGQLYLAGNLMLPVNPLNSVLLDEIPVYHPAVFGMSELVGNSHDNDMRELNALYYAGHLSLFLDLKILVGSWLRRLVDKVEKDAQP